MWRKTFTLIWLILLPFSLAITALGQSPRAKSPAQKTIVNNLIGTLKDGTIVDGCDCYLQTLKESENYLSPLFIFLAELDELEAYINVDGKDTRLKLVSQVDYKGKPQIGKKSSRKYTAGDVTVLIEYVVTGFCAPSDESCAFTKHSGTITVTKDSRMQKLTKLIGGCGC